MSERAAISTVLERGRGADLDDLRDRGDWIRLKTIESIAIAGNGHYGSTFSCAELLAVLFYRSLRLDPANPDWPDRDRFLLGKGHVAVGVYPCLADLGFFPTEWLDAYTHIDGNLGDHPDMRRIPGWDFSAGSIGHSLSVGAGMALAARKHGRDYRTFVLLGDGEHQEGQLWEAAMAAPNFGLGNLVAIVDRNQLGLDGTVEELMSIEPLAAKWEAFGWRTVQIDGHDVAAIVEALDSLPPTDDPTPTCVIARTVKGKGVPLMELAPQWHIGHLGDADRVTVVAAIEERIRERRG